ncbi:RNA-directed DNA polymerase, eukaryota [Tanacetum coccineum]
MLKDRGVDLISHCHIRMGNGLRTQFWNEVWIGDTQLRVMFPRIYALEINKDCTVADKLQFSVTSSLRRSVRGGVESSQLALLQTYIEGTLLSNMEDRWVWDLNGEGVFRVKDVRILLDECFLPKAPTATRWVKYVPIKINVFAWKVFLDRLPTRSNLQHRGVLVSDLLCPLCSSAQEDSSHLFFSCRLATDIVRLVCRWWNLSWTPLGSYADWLNWFNSIRLSSKVKDLLEGVLYITWWSVWMFRNQLLFSSKAPRKDVIFDDIVSRSFTWCLSRYLRMTLRFIVSTPNNGIKARHRLTKGIVGEMGAEGTLKRVVRPPNVKANLMGQVIQCLGEKTGGLDQISNKDANILYCLANGVKMHQAAGGPTSLGATSEEGAHPQLSSGHDASANSIAEANPGLSALNDSIPSQQGINKESNADEISKKIKLEDLSDLLKDIISAFFTPDSPQDEPIIVSDESEEEEEVAKDKDTHASSHDKDELEQQMAKAEAEVASLKARPSYSDINQLTDLLLPSKFNELSGDINELKKHVKDMEIELPGDLKEIPTKLETFTSTISNLTSQVAKLKNIQWELPTEFQALPVLVSSVQKKLKTLDSLPSLLNKVTETLTVSTDELKMH